MNKIYSYMQMSQQKQLLCMINIYFLIHWVTHLPFNIDNWVTLD